LAASSMASAAPSPVVAQRGRVDNQNNNGGLDFWLLDKLFGQR
jgi:hypothetical protein